MSTQKNACNTMIAHYEHQFSLPRAPLLHSAPPFYGDMPPDQAPFNDNSFCELVRHLSITCMVSWCHYVVIPPWLVDVTMLSFLHVCAAASWCWPTVALFPGLTFYSSICECPNWKRKTESCFWSLAWFIIQCLQFLKSITRLIDLFKQPGLNV